MNIYEKLAAVQQELKAPKDKKNTFAGYSYRSSEGILEAVKPVLKKYGATITLSDEIVEAGGRIYVKSTAKFWDTVITRCQTESEDGMFVDVPGHYVPISVTAYAREAETKKGLDDSQITGTASSYARKYALNGLLLIDDTKDADTDEYAKKTAEKEIPMRKAADDIRELAKKAKVTEESICKQAGVDRLESIDAQTYAKLKAALMAQIHVNEKLEA